MMEEIVIRQYRKEDRATVRDIAWDTAFMGQSASAFFDDKEILSTFLTQYFTDYEPDSCFVASTSTGRVIGYLLGAKNTIVLTQIIQAKVIPRLLIRAIMKGTLLKTKNSIFTFHCLVSFLRQEFKMPDFSKEYSAILHINIDQDWRNLKIGSRLLNAYLEYLVREKICGVYLATFSDKAREFFIKQGFNLLHKGQRSYFRYILHRDVPVYIYGKKL